MALSQLELQRKARIEANQARLQSIGLLDVVHTIATAGARTHHPVSRAKGAARKAVGTLAPVRRSERVAGSDAPNYNEDMRLLSLADGETKSRDRRLMRDNVAEEVYEVEHLDALGSRKQEWELFVDGYDASGNRIYDKINGMTCHQCRQKTLGKRTSCSGCHTLQGVLCGDCLFMRYGENVDEANANPGEMGKAATEYDWLCPLCRDICNCSFHRSKRGWAPTGTLYRHAIAEGYNSVAHFLVLNNLDNDAKPVALKRGMCPPELADELMKELKDTAATSNHANASDAGQEPAPNQGQAVVEQLLQPDDNSPPNALPVMRRSARGHARVLALVAEKLGQQAGQTKRRQTIVASSDAMNKSKRRQGLNGCV